MGREVAGEVEVVVFIMVVLVWLPALWLLLLPRAVALCVTVMSTDALVTVVVVTVACKPVGMEAEVLPITLHMPS